MNNDEQMQKFVNELLENERFVSELKRRLGISVMQENIKSNSRRITDLEERYSNFNPQIGNNNA